MRTTRCLAALVAAFTFLAMPASAATPLFGDAVPVAAPASGHPSLSTRVVTLEPALVSRLAAPGEASPPSLSVRLEPGATMTVRRTGSGEGHGGVRIWSGEPADDEAGYLDLVIRDGRVTGQAHYRNRIYRIDPAGPGLATLRRIDPTGFAEDKIRPMPGSSAFAGMGSGPDGPSAITRTKIRILIGYTPGAADAVSDIVAEANLAITLANTAFRKSGVRITYVLAGALSVNAEDDDFTFDGLLDALTNDGGVFATLRSQRDSRKADLVSLFTGRTDYCGLAWLGPVSDAYAFSVVSSVCVTYYSFAHEAGHNFGLRHDRYVEASAGKGVYNFGFVNKSKKIRSIMAYDNACADAGFSCTRVNMFSTPNRTWDGNVMGIEPGTKGAAFAARYLNEKRRRIAGLR